MINSKKSYLRDLPAGYILRPPAEEDLHPVVDLIQEVLTAYGNDPFITVEDVDRYWHLETFQLDQDAFLVETQEEAGKDPSKKGGQVVGYADLMDTYKHAHLQADSYVHAEHLDKGLGSVLVKALVERARQHLLLAPPELRVFLRHGLDADESQYRSILEQEGFQLSRHFYRMAIELRDAPEAAVWPEGIELRPFQKGRDERTVFNAFEESFRDHWGFHPWNYNNWVSRHVERDNFDPNLWILAWYGDQLAGGSLCRLMNGKGYLNQLAVRRLWRGKGLGRALLLETFDRFYQMGIEQVELSVDAANETGATRLYERAGMAVSHHYVTYDLELRPGLELEGE
jgi:mycothiol synthase